MTNEELINQLLTQAIAKLNSISTQIAEISKALKEGAKRE
jgi:hypothetical protein